MNAQDFSFDADHCLMYKGKRCTPIIRDGGSRKIFILPCGKKVAKVSKGGVQNKIEWHVYNKMSTEDKKFFPKLSALIEHSRGFILIEEKLNLKYGKVTKDAVKIVLSLQRKYCIGDLIVREWGRRVEELDNWAINGDTNAPVIFDFGL